VRATEVVATQIKEAVVSNGLVIKLKHSKIHEYKQKYNEFRAKQTKSSKGFRILDIWVPCCIEKI
jgi:hypothetical protein